MIAKKHSLLDSTLDEELSEQGSNGKNQNRQRVVFETWQQFLDYYPGGSSASTAKHSMSSNDSSEGSTMTNGSTSGHGQGEGRIADAVVIATLDRDHAEAVREFSKRGYAILCEKVSRKGFRIVGL